MSWLHGFGIAAMVVWAVVVVVRRAIPDVDRGGVEELEQWIARHDKVVADTGDRALAVAAADVDRVPTVEQAEQMLETPFPVGFDTGPEKRRRKGTCPQCDVLRDALEQATRNADDARGQVEKLREEQRTRGPVCVLVPTGRIEAHAYGEHDTLPRLDEWRKVWLTDGDLRRAAEAKLHEQDLERGGWATEPYRI